MEEYYPPLFVPKIRKPIFFLKNEEDAGKMLL